MVGDTYGRVIAIVAASLSAVGALLSIPAYPFWSLAIFAISIIVIHQVATHGAEGAGGVSSPPRQVPPGSGASGGCGPACGPRTRLDD